MNWPCAKRCIESMEAIRNIFSNVDEPIRGILISKNQLQTALKNCKYLYPSEAERDIIETSSTFTDLVSSSDVYVSNDGIEHNLICLDGTIPVNYKGTTYQIPICIWLSKQHPNLPPLVQVKPTSKMTIKVGKNVDDAGMVSIAYLDEWDKATSDLVGLIEVLCCVFGESTPLYSSDPKGLPSGTKDKVKYLATSKPIQVHSNKDLSADPAVMEASENADDVRNRKAKLLLDVDSILTSAHIIKSQLEELIVVMERSKEELIKGPIGVSKLNMMSEEKKLTEEWLVKLKKDFNDANAKSSDTLNKIFDIDKNDEARSVSASGKSYQDWSNDDVCKWFESIGMAEHVGSVKQHGIRGVHLPNLAKDDLIELGIVKLGQRMTIDDEINKLCNHAMNVF